MTHALPLAHMCISCTRVEGYTGCVVEITLFIARHETFIDDRLDFEHRWNFLLRETHIAKIRSTYIGLRHLKHLQAQHRQKLHCSASRVTNMCTCKQRSSSSNLADLAGTQTHIHSHTHIRLSAPQNPSPACVLDDSPLCTLNFTFARE